MIRTIPKKARLWLCATALTALATTGTQAQSVDFFKSNYTTNSSAGRSIARGWDNNFYFAGSHFTGGSNNSDLLLVKIKPNGDTLWTRTLPSPDRSETGYCVLTPLSNEVMVAGISSDTARSGSANAFLMHFNDSGRLVWRKDYPISGKTTAVANMLRLNNGFALCGTIADDSTGNIDAWLLRTDLNGNKLWDRSYGGALYDDAWQIERTPNGGFMLAGGSYSYRTGTRHDDAWLVKTDDSGRQIWNKHYGNADTVDWIWSLAPVGNPAQPTGYIFTGVKNRNPNRFRSEMFLARVDTSGNVIWDKRMVGPFDMREGLAIEPTFNGTFYVLGSEFDASGNGQLLAMNIDSNGNILNELRYSSLSGEWLIPRNIFINNLGDAYVTGQQLLPGNNSNAFVARIKNINNIPAAVETVAAPSAIRVYPNPATKICTVASDGEAMTRLVVRDLSGRLLREISRPAPHAQTIALEDLPRGIVVITVYTSGIAPVNLKLSVE